MTQTDLKKYSLAEVVLFFILLLGVGLAWLSVRSKSDIVFTKPIVVNGLGFGVCLPDSAGWKADSDWKFKDRAFYISSLVGKDQESPSSQVLIEFSVAENNDIDRRLLERAASLRGSLGSIFTISAGGVKTRAAEIFVRSRQATVFCGIADLGMSRTVQIEILDTGGSGQWSRSLMQDVAARLVYKQPQELKTGAEVIASVKKNSATRWLKTQPRESYYFLTYNNNPDSGFLAELYAFKKDQSRYNLHAVNAYFVRDLGGEESFFQADEDLSQWVWASNLLDDRGTRAGRVELYFGSEGSLSIRRDGQAELAYPSPASFSQMLFNAVLENMAATKIPSVIIDLIDSDGRIIPTNVKLVPEKAGFVAQINNLDGSNIKQTLTLDANIKLQSSTITGPRNFKIKPASKDVVLAEFSIWSDYIQSLDRLLDSDTQTPQPNRSRRVVPNGSVI